MYTRLTHHIKLRGVSKMKSKQIFIFLYVLRSTEEEHELAIEADTVDQAINLFSDRKEYTDVCFLTIKEREMIAA